MYKSQLYLWKIIGNYFVHFFQQKDYSANTVLGLCLFRLQITWFDYFSVLYFLEENAWTKKYDIMIGYVFLGVIVLHLQCIIVGSELYVKDPVDYPITDSFPSAGPDFVPG